MKTNSLQKGSRSREQYGSYAWAIFACLVVIVGFIFSGTTENILQTVFSPLWQGSLRAEGGVAGIFSVFSFKQSLIDENAKLKAQVQNLSERQADYDAVKNENAQLSAELGRKPKEASFAAAIILRPPELPYDTFMLDLGSADGISLGDTVLGQDGTYLGVISELYDHSSKALLASTSGIETKTMLSRVPVSFIGKGGGTYEARIPQAVQITEGDTAAVVPDSFILGKVAKIEVDANNAYRRVVLSSGINLSEAGYVFIVKKAK